jgi:hypothetical protein
VDAVVAQRHDCPFHAAHFLKAAVAIVLQSPTRAFRFGAPLA